MVSIFQFSLAGYILSRIDFVKITVNVKTGLDTTDIPILDAVQRSGPMSKFQLARVVKLASTPCWNRLGKLKKAGSIRGYHTDADIHTNPFELGLGRLVNVEMAVEFIEKTALRKIRDAGVSRRQVGLILNCAPLPRPNTTFWAIEKDGKTVGKVTSAANFPRLRKNIVLAMVSTDCVEIGTIPEVLTATDSRTVTVVEIPFYDPESRWFQHLCRKQTSPVSELSIKLSWERSEPDLLPGRMSVTRIELRPTIRDDIGFTIDNAGQEEAHEHAFRYCFIANALAASVEINIH